MEQMKHTWPDHCVWPAPFPFDNWTYEEAYGMKLDEEGVELLEIREYYDDLVEEGILDEDYSLNDESDEEWEPDTGEDYWIDGRFDADAWEEELSEYMNRIKLPVRDIAHDPVIKIRDLIDYEFANENLLRQAFTRRSFGKEYNVGDSEQLEFLGDSVMNCIVTKIIIRQLTENDTESPAGPFRSRYDEGQLSRIRTAFISQDYLAERAKKTGIADLILYGSDEQPSNGSYEDAMEALIGAVAADSDFDWEVLENVIDRLLCVQLTEPDRFLKKTHYEMLNSWHQKHYGRLPDYEIHQLHTKHGQRYQCTLRFSIPVDHDCTGSHRIDAEGETRSLARERAAYEAYAYLVSHGLWINLKDAHLVPSLEHSINQLQELYQKGYTEQPVYEFKALDHDEWHCSCICSGVNGYGTATGKTKAKKKAAYMILVRLMEAAGLCEDEWKQIMWQTVESYR